MSNGKGVCFLVRAAALVSGDGSQLQSLLDAVYFNEIQNFELAAIISSSKNANALKRAEAAGVDSFVVDPELFPNITNHSMAVANKMRDMDIDLVILAGYSLPLGVIPYQYKNHIIGTFPSLIPSFPPDDGNIFREAIERGIKITGATAYFADTEGCVGPIIMQQAVEVLPGDTPESLRRRIMEEAEWKLLIDVIRQYCKPGGGYEIHGSHVIRK